ncbi:MAG: WbqC family protein [Gammaproteobacteria bacterium]
MQPYFFPYLGHFSLISAVNKWIVFDITQYTPKSWMNRNRILHPKTGWQYITVPLSNSSISIKTHEARVLNLSEAKASILGKLSHYKKKAPHFEAVNAIVNETFDSAKDDSLVHLNVLGLKTVCRNLGIPFNYQICSELNLSFPEDMGAGDWAPEICSQLGATSYLNPIGGKDIFDMSSFSERGVLLQFAETSEFTYNTSPYLYEPGLSILDALMWNPAEVVAEAIRNRLVPITYNHVKYFAQAIDSILAQQVDFEFEVIIGEDESSDGTRELALEYQRRFPDKITVLLHSRKDVIYVNGKATGRWNFVDTISHARGKYIALLPCDDFWTDPQKLQKQVDVMEAHPEYSICGHWIQNVDENGEILDSERTLGKSCPEIFTARQALAGTLLHPNSWLFRRFDLAGHPRYPLFLKLPAGDDPLMLMLLARGNGYCIRESMSAYRLHPGGTWSSMIQEQKLIGMLQFRVAALQLTDLRLMPEVLKIIYQSAESINLVIVRETWRTRSLDPIRRMFKVIRLQQTMKLYILVPLFLSAIFLLPMPRLLYMVRRFVKRVRVKIGGAS